MLDEKTSIILEDSSRDLNMDETCFNLSLKGELIIGKREVNIYMTNIQILIEKMSLYFLVQMPKKMDTSSHNI